MSTLLKTLVPAVAVAVLLSIPAAAEQAKHEIIQAVATVDQDGVQRVEVLGGGYFYKPNYIIVKVNVPVELTIKKEAGFTPHDFVIKAPEAGIVVSETLDAKPKVVKFTPTKVGKYPFYCSKKVPFMASHKDKGMDGMLEVQ
jgi:plastocyanin domain-containing protein